MGRWAQRPCGKRKAQASNGAERGERCQAWANAGLAKNGAGYRIRTRGPLITNQVLYQLS